MSISKISVKIAAFIVITLLWAACQKEASNQLVESQNNSSQERLSGVVPDDPFMLSQVPVIMSADYLANGLNPSVNPGVSLTTRGKPDNILPTISITSPTNGASVSGTINVLVYATDNVGVTAVTLSVDGALVSSSSASPFTNSWNSGLVTNGTHTLMVTAKDAAGNQKTSSIQVTVNNVSGSDITAPTVNITSPANGSAYNAGTTVNISISATDNVAVTSIAQVLTAQ